MEDKVKDSEINVGAEMKVEKGFSKRQQEEIKNWQLYINRVKLGNILQSELISVLGAYEVKYNEEHKERPIKFNVYLKVKKNESQIPVGASLAVVAVIEGKERILQNKYITFDTVGDAKAEQLWLYSLCQAALESFVFMGINHISLRDHVSSLTAKPQENGNSNEGTGEDKANN